MFNSVNSNKITSIQMDKELAYKTMGLDED